MTNFAALAATAAALTLSSAAVALAAPPPFNFYAVEFQSHDQRVPLAQAYVARTMAPGEPMSVAVAAARKAGARCGRPDASGVTVCTESSQQRPAGRGMDDVLWTVRITPAADGTVAHATVARTVAGM